MRREILRSAQACLPEDVGGKAGSTVGQDMGNEKRGRISGFRQEADCIDSIFGIVKRQMDDARTAVDGDIEVALARFTISGAQTIARSTSVARHVRARSESY